MEENNILETEVMSEDDCVTCELCQNKFKIITHMHLKKFHNIDMEEYKKMFPHAKLVSENKRKLMSDINKGPRKNSKKIKTPIIEEIEDNNIEFIKIKTNKNSNNITDILSHDLPLKDKLFSIIKEFFPESKKDFFIDIPDPMIKGSYLCSYITDFCDPNNKIVFDFPDVFFHNKTNACSDQLKYMNLTNYGWKIFVIPGVSPKYSEIINVLENYKY